jgi:preprotein translocase subunit SecD/SecD/SecF fusion protein
MLQIARWRIILVAVTVVAAAVITFPNFFSARTVATWPGFLQRQVVLGLDLQGGAYLLYEVDQGDYVQKRLRTVTSDVRRAMLEGPRIGYTGLGVQGQAVQLRVRDLDRLDDVRTRLEELRSPLETGLLSGGGLYEFDLIVNDDGLTRLQYSPAGLSQRVRGIIDQSMEVIGRRIDELGTTEPSIQRQGEDRILVEAPGLGDPERLKALVGRTAQMTFHLVDSQISVEQEGATPLKAGTIRVPDQDNPSTLYVLEESPLMTGEDLVDAQAGFDNQTSEPVVTFRLSTAGARKFGDVTAQNVGRLFAIVLDDVSISAPVIREPILGGSGQISGSFTVETANDLAILLRAGSLPAKLTIVEERTVGPGLGADSIAAGKLASVVGTVAVAAYMFATYGMFGLVANVALIVNVTMIFAVLTALGATLTLPGIAGIVLTVGMAVDSNVLIYERIREEFRQGRSAISAIDVGFKRALGTILDANITTLIAALVLFQLGSGPIRGFAVTHAIGIVTTVFTAFTFTRMIIALWVAWRRPKTVTL